jgi:hypothetical protein
MFNSKKGVMYDDISKKVLLDKQALGCNPTIIPVSLLGCRNRLSVLADHFSAKSEMNSVEIPSNPIFPLQSIENQRTVRRCRQTVLVGGIERVPNHILP